MTGGRPQVDDRQVLNGIVREIRAGAAWRGAPARYGSWHSTYTRFRRWTVDGTFERVRTHQHAVGAKGGTENRAIHRITPLVEGDVD
ncbi:transposase [Micromonospora taraxaci]|uniref:transposase n=1 Tax=Micromonospora taraxaci TaxID=1316803 RepID=UPI003C2BD706